jgi:hypothetical protein
VIFTAASGYANPDYAGMQMWTCDPPQAYTNFSIASGVLDLGLVIARRNVTITKLGVWVDAAGVGPTGGDYCGLGIYQAGQTSTLLGQTANSGVPFESTGFAEIPLLSGVPVVAGQAYYLAMLIAFTTTSPSVRGVSNGSDNMISIPAAGGLFPTCLLTGQASLPASVTQASLTGDTGTVFETAR